MTPGKRILGALFLLDGATFLIVLGIVAWHRSATLIIPAYALRWQAAEALLSFVPWLPALQFLGTALALGSLAGKSDSLLRGSMAPAMILSTILAAFVLIVSPTSETNRQSWLDLSRSFNTALSDTRSALSEGRVVDARASWGVLRAIDRRDPRAAALEESLLAAEAKSGSLLDAAPGTAPLPRDPLLAKKELALAEDYFRQSDFYSAQWHAKRASELDPGLAAAGKLADRAGGEILASGGNKADAATAIFFARKMEAFGRLRSGDSIGAYRLFSAMAREDPRDADVKRYLAESLAAIEGEAFFKDEADEAAAARLFPDFFIVLPTPGGGTTALAAKAAAFTPAAAYFFDLEYLGADAAGHENVHLMTAYAKLVANTLLFESVEREHPATVFAPRLGDGKKPPLSAAVKLDVLTAYRLAAGLRQPASASIIDLFLGATEAPRYGLSDETYMAELLRRLGLPFSLFGASVLGALVGIRFRNPKARPSGVAWLAFPLMAATAALAWLVVDAADAILSSFVLRIAEGPAALAVSAGLRGVILALLIVIASALRQHVPGTTRS